MPSTALASGLPSAKAQDASGVEAAQEQPQLVNAAVEEANGPWACDRCTANNPSTYLVCSACRLVRGGGADWSEECGGSAEEASAVADSESAREEERVRAGSGGLQDGFEAAEAVEGSQGHLTGASAEAEAWRRGGSQDEKDAAAAHAQEYDERSYVDGADETEDPDPTPPRASLGGASPWATTQLDGPPPSAEPAAPPQRTPPSATQLDPHVVGHGAAAAGGASSTALTPPPGGARAVFGSAVLPAHSAGGQSGGLPSGTQLQAWPGAALPAGAQEPLQEPEEEEYDDLRNEDAPNLDENALYHMGFGAQRVAWALGQSGGDPVAALNLLLKPSQLSQLSQRASQLSQPPPQLPTPTQLDGVARGGELSLIHI